MKVKWGGRGVGKTMAMLGWLADHPDGVLLVFNEREAARVRGLLPIPEGWTDERARSYLERRVRKAEAGCLLGQRGPVAFDNLDVWLTWTLGGEIDVATATTGGELLS